MRKAVRIGLFLKIFLLSSAVSLISLIGGYWLLEKEMVSRVSRILKSESQLVLDQLSHAIAIPVITDDRLTINDLLQTFSLQNGVKEIFVRGKDGKLLGDSIKGHPPVLGNQLPAVNAESKIFFHHFEQFKYALASKTIFFGKVPIGTISIVFSDKPYRIIRNEILSSFLVLGMAGLILSLGGALFLSRFLTRPIKTLHQATQSLMGGDYSLQLTPSSHDELGDLTEGFNQMVKELHHKELLQNALIRYVSHDMAERILLNPELIHLGGIRQEVVVLFADIRNFTRLSNILTPEQTVAILNEYYGFLIRVVLDYQGSVNNIMGDGFMAVFGIPEFLPDHPRIALECATALREAIKTCSKSRMERNLPIAEFGMGIHIGDGIVGNIGSGMRMEYTVVGQTVNVASRLETLAQPSEILVSMDLCDRAGGSFSFSEAYPVPLKGMDKEIRVCRLLENTKNG
ncbi:MAG: HAMP domain-containing protein [Nitrospirae bacterium]|nr:HAMP domain-containing protein [Nitrospirota bacterium]